MRYFSLILLLLPILGNSQNINLNENIQTLIDNLIFDIEHDKDFRGTSDSIRIFVNGIRFNSEQLTQFDAKDFVSIEIEKHGLERLKDAMEYDKAYVIIAMKEASFKYPAVYVRDGNRQAEILIYLVSIKSTKRNLHKVEKLKGSENCDRYKFLETENGEGIKIRIFDNTLLEKLNKYWLTGLKVSKDKKDIEIYTDEEIYTGIIEIELKKVKFLTQLLE